jgi:hypothetical protein
MASEKRHERGTGRAAPKGSASAASSAVAEPFVEITEDADRGAVRPQEFDPAEQPALTGTGFTYRHNWGLRRGQWTLRLNWSDVSAQSHVFVSIAEGAAGGPDAGKFIGAARYTLHNVAPRAGGVDIWVNVEWSADIPLYVDYLVVNPGTVSMRTVQVTVHRHSAVALTDAEADRILADMGTVLQNSDSATDVVTRVRFARNGAVRVLPATVPGTIQTQAEWNTLMAAGTGAKVVQSIRWCGGPGGSIIGCAPVGNPTVNFAVVRFTANQEGVLWVHEYGHNTGNGHRSDDGRAVMFPSIGADHTVVDATESGRYLSGPVAITGAAVMPAACCQELGMEPPADIRTFVSQHWIEGVPYELASQYTEEDARRLVGWLEAPAQHEEFLPEIVTTLCFIGSDVAVQPLIDFVESPRAGRAVFNAKNAALIHMGDLINASGSQAALDFLASVASDMDRARALAQPQAVVAAAETAAAGVASSTAEMLASELAVSATFGLSLAGMTESEQIVTRLRDDDEAFAAVNQAAVEAAEVARTVRARGTKEYHRTKSANRPRL